MSNIKLIRNLKSAEVESICDNSNGCANCPLLISSYRREIHCIKDEKVRMYEVEEAYKLLNTKINLNTNKIV